MRFVRDVLGDSDRAEAIEDESLENYAARRRIRIQNPKGVTLMAVRTRRELLDRVEELETENEDLQSRLDEIKDIIGDEDEEDEGEE